MNLTYIKAENEILNLILTQTITINTHPFQNNPKSSYSFTPKLFIVLLSIGISLAIIFSISTQLIRVASNDLI